VPAFQEQKGMNLQPAEWLSLLPGQALLVFVAELCVVTLFTLRVIFIARGKKVLAPLVGFFEVTIWLYAIGQVMKNMNDVSCFLAFAGGFTLGSFLGLWLEKWLALGTVVVRTITNKDATLLIADLRQARFGVTSLDATGSRGPVKLVFTVVRRKELDGVLCIVRKFDPQAFYSVDEIQETGPGIFRDQTRLGGLLPLPAITKTRVRERELVSPH
jgi:uncharacterized protein YebE (UPF0316 family)